MTFFDINEYKKQENITIYLGQFLKISKKACRSNTSAGVKQQVFYSGFSIRVICRITG